MNSNTTRQFGYLKKALIKLQNPQLDNYIKRSIDLRFMNI